MENAAEALKTMFAVFVFALALTVFFRMTSLAKDTTDMIFASIDKTTYIDYNAAESQLEANRKVTFGDIMPTIYRYAGEGYGVTIIDGDEIVARFDLDTESQVSSCLWTDVREKGASNEQRDKSKKVKEEIIEYLNKYILSKAKISNISNINGLNSLIKNIYSTGDSTEVYTSWLTSNTYQNNNITQRVNCDIYGGTTNFSLVNPGKNETNPANIAGTHKSTYSNGLLGKYKNSTFTEYVVEIDRNEYIKDENDNETDLLVFGTIRYTKKRELIYVVNK